MPEDNGKDKEIDNPSEIDTGASPEEDIQINNPHKEIVEKAEEQDRDVSAVGDSGCSSIRGFS